MRPRAALRGETKRMYVVGVAARPRFHTDHGKGCFAWL